MGFFLPWTTKGEEAYAGFETVIFIQILTTMSDKQNADKHVTVCV